jgi:hypothetical protein
MLKYRWPVRYCFLLLMLAPGAPAMAQTTAQSNEQGGIGVPGRCQSRLRSVYFGVNFMAAKVASNFWFRPGGEVGVGNRTSCGFQWRVHLSGGYS